MELKKGTFVYVTVSEPWLELVDLDDDFRRARTVDGGTISNTLFAKFLASDGVGLWIEEFDKEADQDLLTTLLIPWPHVLAVKSMPLMGGNKRQVGFLKSVETPNITGVDPEKVKDILNPKR